MNRLPGLDLLRAFAILWVMHFHALMAGLEPPVPAVAEIGWMGVDLFFALSGYLIGWQVLKPHAAGETPSFGQFYLRRAFRILPAYLVVLLLYFTIPAFREAKGIQPWWQFVTFTENFFIDYFRNRAFSHVWSLCVEEHFYLVFPFAAWLLARRAGAGTVIGLFTAAVLAGMALRGAVWWRELQPLQAIQTGEGNFFQRYIELIYYPTYMRLDELLAGVAVATVRAFRPALWQRLMDRANLLLLAGLCGLGITCWLFRDRFGLLPAVIGFPLLAASLALLVAAAANPASWLGRLRVPGAGLAAAMAFSLYLTHKQAFSWVNKYLAPLVPDNGYLHFALYAGVAFLTGATLYYAVERPFLRLRERLEARRQAKDAAGALPQPAAG